MKGAGPDPEPEHELRTSGEDAEFLEDRPISSGELEAVEDDTLAFLATHQLEDEVETFRKASRLLNQSALEDDDCGRSTTEVAAQRRETTHKWHQPRLLYFTVAVCSLGAIEQGMAQTGTLSQLLGRSIVVRDEADSPLNCYRYQRRQHLSPCRSWNRFRKHIRRIHPGINQLRAVPSQLSVWILARTTCQRSRRSERRYLYSSWDMSCG
jgi:hypothetical protein